MADTSEFDEQQKRGIDQSNNEDAYLDPNSDEAIKDAERETSKSPVNSTTVKRVKMDGDKDGDGAPSSLESSPKRQKGDYPKGQGDGQVSVSFDTSNMESPTHQGAKSSSTAGTPRTPSSRVQTPGDLSSLNMSTSWDGSVGGGSSKAGLLADPVKIAKEREKEERVRQARERLAEERKKKLEELKEQQRIAQENREKQLEMRKRKIEDLRRRDVERRAAVEERRKMKEEMERIRRESILQKAEERVARYEAWKAGGRKGMFGMDSGTPKHLSMSTSVLYHKRTSDFSSSGVLSPVPRPESALGTSSSASGSSSGTYHFYHPSTGAASGTGSNRNSMTASMPSPVRMRDKTGPRKQRPASVASSMPSFVGGEPAKTPRSRSTDRAARDRSKARPGRREDRQSKGKENAAAGKSTTQDGGEKKEKKGRTSLSFFDRLSTPKFQKGSQEPAEKEKSPHKEAPFHRRSSLKEKPTLVKDKESSSPKPGPAKEKETTAKTTTVKDKDVTAKPTSARLTPKHSPAKEAPSSRGATAVPAHTRSASPATGGKSSNSSTPRVTPPPSTSVTPTPSAPEKPSEKPSVIEDGTTAPRITQDITAEEYKARLAEKRRQAREKAEKEAEEERKKQEEARLAEEERMRQEEEEQRRMEEESLRLAAENRKAEEERLQRAIEAEEKRKREEAERLEEEKKAKEEAEKKAKEEAERLEKERQERARLEEEERLQRKKKLEMIMKRVKPDSSSAAESGLKTDSPTKSANSSPNVSQVGSSRNSPEEHAKPIVPQGFGDATEGSESVTQDEQLHDTKDVTATSSEDDSQEAQSHVVRSASSGDVLDVASHDEMQQSLDSRSISNSMMDTPVRSGNSTDSSSPAATPSSDGTPKFKSPLLQQLVENKGGDSSSSPKFKSPLLQSLLGKTKAGARMGLSASMGDLSKNKDSGNTSTATSQSLENSGSDKEVSKQGKDEDKDEDTLEADRNNADKSFPTNSSQSFHGFTNGISSSIMSDSALGTSIQQPHLDSPNDGMTQSTLLNGHVQHKNGLEDSSISLHTPPEGFSTSASLVNFEPDNSVSHTENISGGNGQFEELIDLLDNTTGNKSNALVPGPPIIAFDENRRADVTESLS